MKYAVEMSSGEAIYIQSFIKIQMSLRGIHMQTHRQQDDLISRLLFFFFKMMKSRLEMKPSKRILSVEI
jgi:hypothetical protein